MSRVEKGVAVTLFIAVIGCYMFTFTAWRDISNHTTAAVKECSQKVTALHLEFTERVTRIETKLEIDYHGGR